MTEKIKDLIDQMRKSDKVIALVGFGSIVALLSVLIVLILLHMNGFA